MPNPSGHSNLTPEERIDRSKKAARARWASSTPHPPDPAPQNQVSAPKNAFLTAFDQWFDLHTNPHVSSHNINIQNVYDKVFQLADQFLS